MADKSLRWSERALEDNRKLLDYLLNEWGEDIASRVNEHIDQTISRISTSPEHFPMFIKRKKIRRCVMSPQTSIFFKANKNEIIIISLFDNRQDPKKRKL